MPTKSAMSMHLHATVNIVKKEKKKHIKCLHSCAFVKQIRPIFVI